MGILGGHFPIQHTCRYKLKSGADEKNKFITGGFGTSVWKTLTNSHTFVRSSIFLFLLFSFYLFSFSFLLSFFF